MKEKLLLVGCGGFGRVVLEHVINDYDVAFLDDGSLTEVNGVSVIGRISDMKKLYPEFQLLLVAIGNNSLRERIYKDAEKIGYQFPNIIVPSAYISPYAKLGTGVIVLNNAVIQNNAKIGSGTILNPGVEAHHDSTIGEYSLIYTNTVIRSLTHIGNRVRIGSNATVGTGALVADDMTIEDGAVIKCSK